MSRDAFLSEALYEADILSEALYEADKALVKFAAECMITRWQMEQTERGGVLTAVQREWYLFWRLPISFICRQTEYYEMSITNMHRCRLKMRNRNYETAHVTV